MRLLTFQARRFRWKAFEKTFPEAADVAPERAEAEVRDAVVCFVHAQEADEGEGEARVFKHTLKHLKWLAGKRDWKNVVLHSFTHLGGSNASGEFANDFLTRMDERLSSTGYTVARTPFGYVCEWDLEVYGESLAKVWKEI